MKRRYYSTAGITPALDDPNYPGIPAAPSHVAKSTVKSQVDYPTFVNGYARRISSYAFTMVAGITAVIGSYIHVRAEWGVILIAVGAGMAAAGGAGLLATWASHEQWYNAGLGVSTTETYAPPVNAQPGARAFVATDNGKRTRTGRLQLAPTVWQSLIDMALANNGAVTKTIAMRAGVDRQWYHTDYATAADGFRQFLIELRRLGFIDAHNGITAAAVDWYNEQYPALPLAASALRPGADRPTRDRPGDITDGDGVGGWE